MHFQFARAGTVVLVVLCAAIAHAEMLLDFEDLPRFTRVTEQYASRGVRFVHDGPDVNAQGMIADFALGDFGGTADFGSSPNQAMVIGGAGGRTSAIFVNPITLAPQSTDFFSVRVGDGDPLGESFRVAAYDSQGAALFQQDYATTNGPLGGGVTVALSAGDIARVEFIHLPSESGFNVDDFSFNPTPSRVVQWPTSVGGNGHWYAQVVPPSGISWNDAKTAAENWIHMGLPGHLATITSAEEDAFIGSMFNTHISWIGLSDERQQGAFEWVTGEPLEFTHWWPSEPMNRPGEDYVQVEQGQWNDSYDVASPPSDYATQKYLVEWSPPPPVPTHRIVIDSILGRRSRPVSGIENMSQADVAREAAALAIAPDGWNLAQCGARVVQFGPGPATGEPGTGWDGGIEWSAYGAAAPCSDTFDYPISVGSRHLMFHTDDTISRAGHNVGEPSPFGAISGFADGTFLVLGVQNWGTFSVEPFPEPPNVAEVRVGGLTWSGAGHLIPLGTSEQSLPLPFTRINQLSLTFDEHVAFGDEQATLTDSAGHEFTLFGPLVAPGAEPGTYTATWQMEEVLPLGRYELRLGDGVVDDDGNALDGEWTNDASTISGDGVPGGEFSFRFNVLPGDVNQNGIVDVFDWIEVRNLQGTAYGSPEYSLLHDIDGRNGIGSADFYAVPLRAYDILPSQPAANAAAVPEPTGAEYAILLGSAAGLCAVRRCRVRSN